jgi:hypothetical protein
LIDLVLKNLFEVVVFHSNDAKMQIY